MSTSTIGVVSPAGVRSVAHLVVQSVDAPEISADDHRHVARVLRARPGEMVTLTDGRGSWRVGAIPLDWDSPSIQLDSLGPVRHVTRPGGARSAELCVAVALAKADKPETVVQKLTELGITRIVLLAGAHSVVRWDADKTVKNLVRLRAVAREAVMQSRGTWMPVIDGIFTPAQFVAAEAGEGRQVAMAQFGGEAVSASHDTVLVGPEGGWSAEELGLCPQRVSLADTVLRAETAAIAAGVLLLGASRVRAASCSPVEPAR